MAQPARLDLYQRIDHGLARFEGAVAVCVLLSMVLVASAQALFFNIAQQNVKWAVAIVEGMSWADIFLQKGTLWLAFVGASLATYEDKHIGLDILPKLAPPQVAAAMRRFAAFGSGIIALMLAWVFLQACLVADAAVPFEYEVLTNAGPTHVCDAAAAALGDTERPAILCAMRGALEALGVSITSGGGIAQLITPVALGIIGLRMLARSVFMERSIPLEQPAPRRAGPAAGPARDTISGTREPGAARPTNAETRAEDTDRSINDDASKKD